MYYTVWKHNECKGVAFGTKAGVTKWATEKWGNWCKLEEVTEEQANEICKQF